MATTLKLRDFLSRWLGNANPGTTHATDSVGRAVITGNKDYLGRNLAFDNPSGHQITTGYDVGDHMRLASGAIMECTVAGTTGGTAPTAPAKGATVTDGTVTWKRIY